MRNLAASVVVLGILAAPATAGGIDYEIKSGVVHQVEVDATRIVFTVSGPCATYFQDPIRDDRANRVETRLKRCVITITKEAFEKSWERTRVTWADGQRSAKDLANKKAFMQLSGTATLAGNRITAIAAGGSCYFRAESKE